MESINAWLGHWEPTWLFLVLFTETLVGLAVLWWTIKEYVYDAQKDQEKKQKKTKTTRKTTKGAAGETTTEETTETSEPTETK
jgi:hypothetical protein